MMDNTTTLPPVNLSVPPVEHTLAKAKLKRSDQRAQRAAGWGATTGGLAITHSYIDQVAEAVAAKLNSPVRPKADGFAFRLERVLRNLNAEVVALALLQQGLHMVATKATLRTVCLAIGDQLNSECWAAELLQSNKELHGKVVKTARVSRATVKSRRAFARGFAEQAGFTVRDWSPAMRIHAGAWGVDILRNATDLFDVMEADDTAYGREGRWIMTDVGCAKAGDAVAQVWLCNPVFQPRLQRPEDWSEFHQPVAEDPRVGHKTTLLRTHHKDLISAARHAMRSGSMSPALTGINALQSVPYVINTWIMDVIEQSFDQGMPVESLPSKYDVEVPELPDASMSPDECKVRFKERRAIEMLNLSLRGDRVLFSEDMETAKRVAVADRFYIPMNCDWRGRVYGISHFNFQREDRVRALFLFANGEAVGEEGIKWLKVHVANCGAFDKADKKPMEDRIAWVDKYLPFITAAALAPIVDPSFIGPTREGSWRFADAPFLFLAAARELVSALQQGPQYVCHLPVSFDGSCSGLQHLSAMTRAPEGRYVNLTDNEQPEDIYQRVADLTKARIEADANSTLEEGPGTDIAKADRERQYARMTLDFGVSRSLVKRNTMVFAYSSKVFGMGQQQFEDTMRPLALKVLKKELPEHPFGDDGGFGAAKYIARKVHASIVDLVRLPAEAMGFLQACAKVLAHEGKPLSWTSPAGIPWINRYHESKTERVELFLNDKGVKTRRQIIVANGYEPELLKDKAAAGVSPNLVHACDASHLLLTVKASVEEGITDIATVHDSFGCLPSRAGRFNQIIREQFLKMYTDHDVLAEVLASAKADLTPANHHKLPELPTKGSLDLSEILKARYAFA